MNIILDTMVRKSNTPFTEASASSGIFFRQVRFADISAQCSPENWEKTLYLLEKTLRTARLFQFTDSELNRVKKEYLSELDKAVKGSSTRKSQRLSRVITRHLNNDRVFQSPEQEQKIFSPVIQSLTASDVHNAFQKIWEPDFRLLSITGNAKIENTPEEKILHVFQDSRKKEVTKPAEEKLVLFPYLPEPTQQVNIVSKKSIDDLGITCVDFQNNLRLNLKPTDFKANEVLLSLAFGSGRSSVPSDKPGLGILTQDVVNASALNSLKKDDLERALAGKNTFIRLNVEENKFTLVGKSVSNEIQLLFQLLYAYIQDMGFGEEAHQLSMERFIQRYKTLEHTIDGGMEISGKRFLAGGDHRFGIPGIQLIQKVTLADIRSWMGNALQNSTFEISVVGDFDPEKVIELTARYLGSLPIQENRQPEKLPSNPPRFTTSKIHEILVPTKIKKAHLSVAYPTDDFWDISRTRRLAVLGAVFSERMRETIREKLGASYSTYAYNNSSKAYKGYGLFQAIAQIDPDEDKTIITEIKNISKDIATKGISDNEMKRALDPIQTSIKDYQRTNKYWLKSVLTGLKKHPQQLEWSRTMLPDYESINQEEIKNLAKQYLDNQKASIVMIKPKN